MTPFVREYNTSQTEVLSPFLQARAAATAVQVQQLLQLYRYNSCYSCKGTIAAGGEEASQTEVLSTVLQGRAAATAVQVQQLLGERRLVMYSALFNRPYSKGPAANTPYLMKTIVPH